MKPFTFRISERHEGSDNVRLDLTASRDREHKLGTISASSEWQRDLTIAIRKETAPQLYAELLALPIDSEFVLTLKEKG